MDGIPEVEWPSNLLVCGLVAALLCVAVGCGGDNEKKPSSEQPDRPKLPCEKQEYPCTFAEVDEDVNQRTLDLMKKVLIRAERGEKWESAIAWLRERSKLVEAKGSSNAIRFRLEGGRPAWVYLQQPGDSLTETTTSALTEANSSESTTRNMPIVAGGDDEPREPKNALVLTGDPTIAPQLTSHVRDKLTGVRGYTPESVTFRTKANELSLSDFQQWGEYDFIYFLAHGGCTGECQEASISTGIELGTLLEYPDERWIKRGENDWDPAQLNPEQQDRKDAYEEEESRVKAEALENSPYADVPGADVAIRPNCYTEDGENIEVDDHKVAYCQNPYELAVGAPFFQSYSDGLDETLVIGNSCKLFSNRASDLAQYFGSGDNVFLGWSESVLGERSSEVIRPLLDLLDEGIPAWTALRTVKDENGVINDSCAQDDSCPAELRHSDREDTIRLREIVSVSDPSGNPLEDGANINAMVQGIPGDGESDSLELTALVAGIDREASTASSDPSDYEVRFEWNGNEVGESYNVGDEGQPISYAYAYAVDDIQVQLDSDIDPDEEYSLTAIVELPEGGTSTTTIEGLTLSPCWAKYDAGELEWDSEKMMLTDPFGIIQIWRRGGEAFSSLTIALQGNAGERRMEAQIEANLDEPGTYSAVFTVLDTEREMSYASPTDSNGDSIRGDLTVDAVEQIGSTNRLIRGTFEGPVTNEESPTYTLTGSFSLPATVTDGSDGLDVTGGAWPDSCSRDADTE